MYDYICNAAGNFISGGRMYAIIGDGYSAHPQCIDDMVDPAYLAEKKAEAAAYATEQRKGVIRLTLAAMDAGIYVETGSMTREEYRDSLEAELESLSAPSCVAA